MNKLCKLAIYKSVTFRHTVHNIKVSLNTLIWHTVHAFQLRIVNFRDKSLKIKYLTKTSIILMAAILEKCSKVHFVCNIFSCYLNIVKSTDIELQILIQILIATDIDLYVSLRPSLGTDKSNFSGLCKGLYSIDTHN